MTAIATAVIGSAILGAGASYMSASAASDAAGQASDAQSKSAALQMAEARRQYDTMRMLLAPYTTGGPGALTGQRDLLGLNGQEAQSSAINKISESPEMASLAREGENAILRNASATGGLRGGNTQASLAQFRPALLNSLINKQYDRLGGMVTLGQNSAIGVGNAGQNASGQVINALQQQGAAQAGNALGQGQAKANLYGGLAQAAGGAFGSIGSFFNGSPQSNAALGTNYGTGTANFGGIGSGLETFGNKGWGAY